MEASILLSTKKKLNVPPDYEVFDDDIIDYINSVFSILSQLGVISPDGFMIEDESTEWEDVPIHQNQMNLVRSYMFLKVRFLFDPPTLSFIADANEKQIAEYEWRLNLFREEETYPAETMEEVQIV